MDLCLRISQSTSQRPPAAGSPAIHRQRPIWASTYELKMLCRRRKPVTDIGQVLQQHQLQGLRSPAKRSKVLGNVSLSGCSFQRGVQYCGKLYFEEAAQSPSTSDLSIRVCTLPRVWSVPSDQILERCVFVLYFVCGCHRRLVLRKSPRYLRPHNCPILRL